MSEIRDYIKNLTVEDTYGALDKILSLVQFHQGGSSLQNAKERHADTIILMKGQYVSAQQDYNSGVITRPERELVFQRVSKSLLEMIGVLPDSFFKLSEEEKKLFYAGKLPRREHEPSTNYSTKSAQRGGKANLLLVLGGLAAMLVMVALAIAYTRSQGQSAANSAQATTMEVPAMNPKNSGGIRLAGQVVCMDSDEPLTGVAVQIDTFKPMVTNEKGKYAGIFPYKLGDRYLLTLTKGRKLLFKDKVMATENDAVIPIQGRNCNL